LDRQEVSTLFIDFYFPLRFVVFCRYLLVHRLLHSYDT
jgi:hypothetical protein